MRSILLILFLATSAAAQAPPSSQKASELDGDFACVQAKPSQKNRGELMRRVEKLLTQQSRYLISTLHPWDQDPSALLLTEGASNENNIRPNAHTAFGLAVLSRCAGDDVFSSEFSREAAHDKAIALLRFLLLTHGAGGKKCKDGKPWHSQWQSALWAYSAGQAAWLLWDDLSPEMKWLAARMICDEADRFVDLKPPMQIRSDTKAEENAWDSQIISLAYNMFPRHPHHEAWRDAAIRWIVNSYPTPRDRSSNDLIDSKPLRQWLVGANVYDDYTLENHDRVHPDYMSTTKMLVFQKLNYEWARNAAPQALDLNVEKIYANLKLLALPDGGFLYPNGQDWQLHRNADWIDDECTMAVMYNDPQAARLMRIVLETAEKMAARSAPNGPISLPHESIFASTQGLQFEGLARALLMLAARGDGPAPVSVEQLWTDLRGLHVFDFGKFAIQRSDRAVASFSWGRQIMGLCVPMDKDLLLTPCERSMIGFVAVDGVNDQPLGSGLPRSLGDAFEIAGILQRGGVLKSATQPVSPPIVEQRFAFVAMPDGTTIYADALSLTSEKRPSSIQLGTVGVLNDADWVWHDGKRTIYFDGGERTFKAADAQSDADLKLNSRWLNLDGKLGILCLESSGQFYHPKPTAGHGAAGRLEQLLHLNTISSSALASAKRFEPLTQTTLVFLPGQSPAQTKAAAATITFDRGDANHGVIHLGPARQIVIDLYRLTVGIEG